MEAIFIAWLFGVWFQLQQAELLPLRFLGITSVCLLPIFVLLIQAYRRSLSALPQSMTYRKCLIIPSCIVVAILGFVWSDFSAHQKMQEILPTELEQKNILVQGHIDSLPEQQSNRWRFQFQVSQAQLDGGEVLAQFPSKILLSWYFSASDIESNQLPTFRVGQEWRFQVRVKAPHGMVNPHSFDYELWLWEQGIGAVGYVRMAKDSPEPVLLEGSSIRLGMQGWREAVKLKINQTVSDTRLAGLIAALTLGDQRAIEQGDWDTFRATGVAHLVSISGLHITMLGWIAFGVAGWLWRRSVRLMLWVPAPKAAILIGLICAALYAWFAGWGIPAQRTVLMLATVVLLRLVGVRWPWYVVWLFIACVVITIDPWAFLQAGFWLSFVAVGVLFAQSEPTKQEAQNDAIQSDIEKVKSVYLPRPWWLKVLHTVWVATKNLLIVQARISIALAPLTLLLFQQVSIVGFFANMLAIPWVTFLMVPLVLLGILFPPFWYLAAWAGEVFLRFLEWCASLPFAVLHGALPPLWLGIVAVVGAIVLVLPLFKKSIRVLGALLILPMIFWRTEAPQPADFRVFFLDVGQGSSVIVQTANHTLLYDTGARFSADSSAADLVVLPTLRALGLKLDKLVISHIDNDHSGGADVVMRDQPQAHLLASAPKDHAIWALPSAGQEVCEAGVSWVWDDVQFEVIYPSASIDQQEQEALAKAQALKKQTAAKKKQKKKTVKTVKKKTTPKKPVKKKQPKKKAKSTAVLKSTAVPASTPKNSTKNVSTNAQSCVLKVSSLKTGASLLLTGDIEQKQEALLVKYTPQILKADLLLLPHHGSKTSSSEAFIEAVHPFLGVAQAGYLNPYGHPNEDVVERYKVQGVTLVNTVSCGAAIWQSHEPSQMECLRQTRRRYWH